MSAVFSPCGTWRYRLDRDIAMFGPPIGFLLHNPSTAGEESEDPTSRRGIGYVKLWQGSRLTFINPWAGVATDLDNLWRMADPVGPMNDFHIAAVAKEISAGGGFIVAAWGAVSPPRRMQYAVTERLHAVRKILRDAGCELRALGVTKDGHPRHPLYMRADAVPVPWPSSLAREG